MSIKLGSTDINKIYLGPTEIKKAYLGSTLIYDKTGPTNGLLNNLVSYYEFENNVLDSQGTNNGTNFGTSDVAGKIDRGRSFDGVNDYITTPMTALGASSFSWNMWINTTTGDTEVIASTSQTTGYPSFIITGGKIQFRITSSGSTNAVSTTSVNDGSWHMITGVRDGTTHKIYIDGVEEDSQVKSGSLNGTTLYLGNFSSLVSSIYYDGLLDEFGFYDRVLTQVDITALYNSGAGLSYSNFTT